MVVWILQIFQNISKNIMLTLLKSLVVPRVCIIRIPTFQSYIKLLQSMHRQFLKMMAFFQAYGSTLQTNIATTAYHDWRKCKKAMMSWLSLLYNFIQQSLNSGSIPALMLFVAWLRFAMGRISDNGPVWK